MCSFIDKYVKCSIPEEEELAQLVTKVQKYRHSATCRRHGKCHLHYPRPPSPETVIARQATAATYPEELAEQGMKALAAVGKVLDDKDTPEDISMDELLTKANVSHSIYLCGFKMCSTGSSIFMQRKPSESWINTYNPDVIRVWRANMDLQFVLDPYACVMYIAAYMLCHISDTQRHSQAIAPLWTSRTRGCDGITNSTYRSGSFQHPRDDPAFSTSAWYFQVWCPSSHTGQA